MGELRREQRAFCICIRNKYELMEGLNMLHILEDYMGLIEEIKGASLRIFTNAGVIFGRQWRRVFAALIAFMYSSTTQHDIWAWRRVDSWDGRNGMFNLRNAVLMRCGVM